MERQLTELQESLIGNVSSSVILNSGGKTNAITDLTGDAGAKLADNPAVRAIKRDIRRYKRFKRQVDELIKHCEKYDFQDEFIFVWQYYFERKRLSELGELLAMSESSLLRLRKKVLARFAGLTGML